MKQTNTIQKQTPLIGTIFNFSKLERITTSDEKISRAFYKLKEDFPEYFERLLFNTNASYPTSSELDDMLSMSKVSGTMKWDGSRHYKLNKYELSDEELKQTLEDFPKIKEVASKFDEYISL